MKNGISEVLFEILRIMTLSMYGSLDVRFGTFGYVLVILLILKRTEAVQYAGIPQEDILMT